MSSVDSLGSTGSLEDTSEDRLGDSSGSSWDKFSTCSVASLEDIQEAIVGIKKIVLETEVNSDQRKEIVHRLIRLRIKEQDLQNRKYYQSPGEVETLRHALVPINQKLSVRSYCEECGSAVWPMLQTIYQCRTCGHLVHAQCLDRLSRKCVGAWQHPLEEGEEHGFYDGTVLYTICPEISLVEQNYECAECGFKFSPNSGHRLCDYTGQWYCQSCHWGYTSPSPARIMHNWDFTPMPVCQASYQYLGLMRKRPVINLENLSPGLSVVAAELSAVDRQRKNVLIMKNYLTVCRVAQNQRLLRKLEERQHFVDNEYIYTFEDLLDIESGVLGTWLGQVLEDWQDHIFSCILCRAKGFVCELCTEKEEILFPFSVGTDTCPTCNAVFHRECFRLSPGCPRCERKKERTLKTVEVVEES